MTELTVLCEGPTEQEFVSLVLRPHLVASGWSFVKPIPVQRGNFGIGSYDTFSRALKPTLGCLREHQYATCMIDLFRLPTSFPGSELPARSGRERAENVERELSRTLGNPRWVPYIQLHEFEALIYVDLDRVKDAFPGADLDDALGKLRTDVGGLEPEQVNGGKDTAPSKRLLRYVPQYAKGEQAANIAAAIGLAALRAACPHFDGWIARLEALEEAR